MRFLFFFYFTEEIIMLDALGSAFVTNLIADGIKKIPVRRSTRKKSVFLDLFKDPDSFAFNIAVENDEIVIRIKKNSQNKQVIE